MHLFQPPTQPQPTNIHSLTIATATRSPILRESLLLCLRYVLTACIPPPPPPSTCTPLILLLTVFRRAYVCAVREEFAAAQAKKFAEEETAREGLADDYKEHQHRPLRVEDNIVVVVPPLAAAALPPPPPPPPIEPETENKYSPRRSSPNAHKTRDAAEGKDDDGEVALVSQLIPSVPPPLSPSSPQAAAAVAIEELSPPPPPSPLVPLSTSASPKETLLDANDDITGGDNNHVVFPALSATAPTIAAIAVSVFRAATAPSEGEDKKGMRNPTSAAAINGDPVGSVPSPSIQQRCSAVGSDSCRAAVVRPSDGSAEIRAPVEEDGGVGGTDAALLLSAYPPPARLPDCRQSTSGGESAMASVPKRISTIEVTAEENRVTVVKPEMSPIEVSAGKSLDEEIEEGYRAQSMSLSSDHTDAESFSGSETDGEEEDERGDKRLSKV